MTVIGDNNAYIYFTDGTRVIGPGTYKTADLDKVLYLNARGALNNTAQVYSVDASAFTTDTSMSNTGYYNANMGAGSGLQYSARFTPYMTGTVVYSGSYSLCVDYLGGE